MVFCNIYCDMKKYRNFHQTTWVGFIRLQYDWSALLKENWYASLAIVSSVTLKSVLHTGVVRNISPTIAWIPMKFCTDSHCCFNMYLNNLNTPSRSSQSNWTYVGHAGTSLMHRGPPAIQRTQRICHQHPGARHLCPVSMPLQQGHHGLDLFWDVHVCSIRLESREFLSSLSYSSGHPWAVLMVWLGTLFCCGVTAIWEHQHLKGCAWLMVVFGWVVHV